MAQILFFVIAFLGCHQVALGQNSTSGSGTTNTSSALPDIAVTVSRSLLITVANIILGATQLAIPLLQSLNNLPYQLIALANNATVGTMSLANVFTKMLESGAQGIANTLGQLLQSGGQGFSQILGAGANVFKILQDAQTAGTALGSNVGSAIQGAIMNAMNVTSLAGNGLLKGVGTAVSTAASATGAAVEGASKLAQAGATGLLSTASNTANEGIQALNSITKSFTDGLTSLFG